jgi:hypothetical protein
VASSSYRQLDPAQIIETVALLQRRIRERFPDAGLVNVVAELKKVAEESAARTEWARRPNILIRLVANFLATCIFAIIFGFLVKMRIPEMRDMVTFIQFLEAALSAIAFIGASIFFLITYETRVKRNRLLRELHQLRSLAHIVDMHQLTKDPDRYLLKATFTESSPKRTMTMFELGRYLDYCCDALALISKVAALYVQGFQDDGVLKAVDDIEDLTSGLTGKIAQKITVLNDIATRTGAVPG